MSTKIEIIGKGKNKKILTGRLLGLIDDKQYAAIINNKDLGKHLLTGETAKLADVSRILVSDPSETYRVVMSVGEMNNITLHKHLFISDRLKMLTSSSTYVNKTMSVEVWVDNNTYIIMSGT